MIAIDDSRRQPTVVSCESGGTDRPLLRPDDWQWTAGPLEKTVSSRDGETAAVVGHDVLESVAMWELTWPSWNRLAVWESDCLGLRWSPAS